MGLLKDIKDLILVALLATTIFTGIWGNTHRHQAERYRNNFNQKKVEWVDEKERLVSEVSELAYTVRELKGITHQDSTSLSDTGKKLLEANKTIQELNIKLKDAESYVSGDLTVFNDSLVSTIEEDEKGSLTALKPIKTDHLQIYFTVGEGKVYVTPKYIAKISVIVNRKEDKLTKAGRRRFFLARLIFKRYTYWATTRVDDKNASIQSPVYLKFQRNRKKRN